MAESISKVLYPEDNHYEGKSLRLKQQYFFVSATIQSIVRKHRAEYGTLRNFHLKHVIQINDTHPTLAIPELMRILLDEEGYGWDEAWYIVTHTVAYTNHTVLAEALERWPQQLIEKLAAPHLADPHRDLQPLPAGADRLLPRRSVQGGPHGHHLGRRGAHGQPVRVRLL